MEALGQAVDVWLGLSDLANKNKGYPVKSEVQINNKSGVFCCCCLLVCFTVTMSHAIWDIFIPKQFHSLSELQI